MASQQTNTQLSRPSLNLPNVEGRRSNLHLAFPSSTLLTPTSSNSTPHHIHPSLLSTSNNSFYRHQPQTSSTTTPSRFQHRPSSSSISSSFHVSYSVVSSSLRPAEVAAKTYINNNNTGLGFLSPALSNMNLNNTSSSTTTTTTTTTTSTTTSSTSVVTATPAAATAAAVDTALNNAVPNTAAATTATALDRISRGIYHNIQSSGKLKISPELQVEFTADDLRDLGEIGRGSFGTVNKMVHRKTNTIMAVKRIRSTVDEKEQKQLLMDLDVVMRSNDCPCIVQFYGAIFKEGDCWICMELMDTSLDKFYKFIYENLSDRMPENILGKITVVTLTALNYLKEKLKIIHRDVKPSNILLDRRGNMKLCDFGISGQLVDSIAKTRDAGCRPYMAPERIDPARAPGYDVRSDVWSLGITLMELATGSFPYPKWNSVFEQLTQVVQGDPPRLTNSENGNTFTHEFVDFVNTCLIKEEGSRPKYRTLLEHEFVVRWRDEATDVAGYVSDVLDKMASNGLHYTYDSYNY